MSRIISGLAGSLRLAQGAKDTRPTADRVKESVFASLESFDQITGANVLDLFAGTGALGLEALSRGAKSLTLVEKSKSALEVCRKNSESVQASLAKQGVAVEVSLRHADALVFLKSNAERYDLVFIDPPYNTGSAFTHYDDGLEHSIWLGLMRDRLEIIKQLLADDGSIWITIDDNEAHYLKALDSKRTKTIYSWKQPLKGLAAGPAYVWALTGTPAPNHLGEWYTHLRTLRPDLIPWGGQPMPYMEFLRRYTRWRAGAYAIQVLGVNPSTRAEFQAMINQLAFRRELETVLPDLPPITWGTINVERERVSDELRRLGR